MSGSLLLTGGRLVTADDDVAPLADALRFAVTVAGFPAGVLFRGHWARSLPAGGGRAAR